MRLDGKKALVTGAKRNIGRGIALALAEAGCDVGINDLEHDAEVDETLRMLRARGGEAAFFAADVSRSNEVNAMTDAFVETFGAIDILVNNAYSTEHQAFLTITEENWERTLGVCLKSYFLCSQSAARAMVSRGAGGAIVNISSVHARAVWQNDTCYGVAKAGIVRLTQSIASELRGYHIRANAILPGYVDFRQPFGTQRRPETGKTPATQPFPTDIPRRTTPNEVGRTTVFLCSSEINVSGLILPLDGGVLAL